MKNEKTTYLLKQVLAGTYVLSLNTQKCHWNVEGINFYSLHLLFEKQYEALIEDVDVLAERLRALGEYAPGTFKEFESLSPVNAHHHSSTQSQEMIKLLVAEYENLITCLKNLVQQATEADDQGTADIALGQCEEREKALWMLKSSLK